VQVRSGGVGRIGESGRINRTKGNEGTVLVVVGDPLEAQPRESMVGERWQIEYSQRLPTILKELPAISFRKIPKAL